LVSSENGSKLPLRGWNTLFSTAWILVEIDF